MCAHAVSVLYTLRKAEVLEAREEHQSCRAASGTAISVQGRQGHQSRAVLSKAVPAQTFGKVFHILGAILEVSQLDMTSTEVFRNLFL